MYCQSETGKSSHIIIFITIFPSLLITSLVCLLLASENCPHFQEQNHFSESKQAYSSTYYNLQVNILSPGGVTPALVLSMLPCKLNFDEEKPNRAAWLSKMVLAQQCCTLC
jgi:hypothetical protein